MALLHESVNSALLGLSKLLLADKDNYILVSAKAASRQTH